MSSLAVLPAAKPGLYRPVGYEAFGLTSSTRLLDPLAATTLKEAIAETVSRWSWDRGDRLGVREIGDGIDQLHVFAVRRKAQGVHTWNGYVPETVYDRWLDAICVIDLNVIGGLAVGAVGTEIDLHEHRQRRRPEGARLQDNKTCAICFEPVRRCRCHD